jgi:phosphoglucosamine mutase
LSRPLTVVIDAGNGAAGPLATALFTALGCQVIALYCDIDGHFPNHHPDPSQPDNLRDVIAAVKRHQAAIGLAFDGDGDRVIMVDHQGHVVDGDQILFIIAKMRHEENVLRGGIVGTVMSNCGLEQAFKELAIPFIRSPVGDRYVLSQLLENGWELGGESSGHIICRHVTTTGDGIISALQVLAVMCLKGKTLLELSRDFEKYPQVMINVKLSKKLDLASNQRINNEIEEAQKSLKGRGRVLLRLSGTEPLVRVMVEGADLQQVNQIARHLSDVVEAEVA